VRESEIEAYFVRRVKEAGGLQRKFVSPGHRGVPDRIVLFAGWMAFAELKRPNMMAEDHQAREHKRIIAQGFPVFILDTKERVDSFIERMKK
jgi:hypothetical protein